MGLLEGVGHHIKDRQLKMSLDFLSPALFVFVLLILIGFIDVGEAVTLLCCFAVM